MNSLYTRYKHSILWSSIESVIFHSLLFIHQYALFMYTTPLFYGVVGTTFGLLYLSVHLLNMGLNQSLAPFYQNYSQSKQHAKTFIKNQIIPNGMMFCCFIIFITSTKHIFFTAITLSDLLVVLACIATESVKKIIKHLLQLSFNFRMVAILEIGFIISYPLLVWLFFVLGFSLSTFLIFGVFLTGSLLHMIGLIYLLYGWYRNLPLLSVEPAQKVSELNIYKTRLFSYMYHLSKQLFSANVLVPLWAYFYGFEQAAVLKLASYATHSITSIIEKIIGPSSAVYFAHSKQNPLQEVFRTTTQITSHVLLCLFIFLVINFTRFIGNSHTDMPLITLSFIYFLMHYIESFFITLETLFISQERSEVLLVNTGITLIFILNSFFIASTPLVLLIFLLAARIISCMALSISAYYLWNIKQLLHISPTYLATSLSVATLFFLLT